MGWQLLQNLNAVASIALTNLPKSIREVPFLLRRQASKRFPDIARIVSNPLQHFLYGCKVRKPSLPPAEKACFVTPLR